MTEYHDHPGDDQHDVPPPETDLPGDPGDAFGEQHAPPPADLGAGHAPPAEELHFPGDEIAPPAPQADLDPAAPWPDDGDFERWLAESHEDAGDEPSGELPAAPDSSETLGSSDELIDWTLRRLAEDG